MKKNEPMQINWNSTSAYKPVVWDLVYSRSMKLREVAEKMKFEEQQYMIQALSDKLQSEKKDKESLRELVDFLVRPKLGQYDGLFERIEELEKIIDDQQQTIKNQKESLLRVVTRLVKRSTQDAQTPLKSFDRALGDIFECPECCVIVELHDNFCKHCGTKLNWGDM